MTKTTLTSIILIDRTFIGWGSSHPVGYVRLGDLTWRATAPVGEGAERPVESRSFKSERGAREWFRRQCENGADKRRGELNWERFNMGY